jgi:hypothetical protein
MSDRYVVAISQSEAVTLVETLDLGHATRAEAEQHLAEIQAPPTDPEYARQFKIFAVPAPADATDATWLDRQVARADADAEQLPPWQKPTTAPADAPRWTAFTREQLEMMAHAIESDDDGPMLRRDISHALQLYAHSLAAAPSGGALKEKS